MKKIPKNFTAARNDIPITFPIREFLVEETEENQDSQKFKLKNIELTSFEFFISGLS